MSTIAERYDRSAAAYLAWWAPVLSPTSLGLLEAVAPFAGADGSERRLLDVGTGTGVLAIAAVERWPALRVAALDGSSGMLDVARAEAARRLGDVDRTRLEFVTGLADRIPFDDRTFDVAVSSFVMQLVPDRSRALRDALRVLRPGGVLAFVTWLVSDDRFAPDEAFYDVLDELEIADSKDAEEARSGDFASVTAAAAQVRRAGFRDVRAREGRLEYRHDPSRYLEFLERYAEVATFEGLSPRVARAVRERTAERLGGLAPEAFVWRAPIVTVTARRPEG